MFGKKQFPASQDLFQNKALNHEFFLLVRDQKYDEASQLGDIILKRDPNNPTILKFCLFLQDNQQQISEMLKEEREYTDDDSDDSEENGSEEDDSEEDENESQLSKSSVSSSVSKNSGQSGKNILKAKQNEVCKLHTWNHICKNKNCPNQK